MPYVPPVDTSPKPGGVDFGNVQSLGPALKSFGEAAGGFLRDRLNKKQYDDFLQGPNKEFSNQVRGIQDLLMDESNPDAAAQGVRQLSSAMTTYMDAAAQFPENPLISQRAKQTWDMNWNIMNQEMVQRQNAAQQKRQAGLDKSKMALQGAQTDAAAALAAQRGTKAQEMQQQASPLWSGDDSQYKDMNNDQKVSAIWDNTMDASKFIKDPTRLKAYDQAIDDTRTQMAQEKLQDMAAHGEQKEIPPTAAEIQSGITASRQVPWDAQNVGDLKQVAASIDNDEVKARWTMNTVQAEARAHGLDPQAFSKYQVRVDPTKASAFNPLDRAVPETTVGKIAMGIGGWNSLFDSKSKTEPKNMDDVVNRLPNSVANFQGPIGKVFKDFPASAKDSGLKSVADVKAALRLQGRDLMLKILAPGIVVEGDPEATERNLQNLDAGRKANLNQAATLVKGAADKYGEEIAQKMGIASPKAAPATAQQPTGKGLNLSRGTVGDVTRPLFNTLGGAFNYGSGLLRGNKPQPQGQE
jgi:hypothetical protein